MNPSALRFASAALFAAFVTFGSVAQAQARKPNILVIWVTTSEASTSAPTTRRDGLQDAEHRQPRARGAMFTDWYGQQSCTAGRAAFVTGQSPIRTASPRSPAGAPRA